MQIAANTKVAIHYTLTDDAGKVIDSSAGRDPLNYIQGRGMIVSGLEKAMAGKDVGDKFNVDVAPAEGYGEYNPELVRSIPRKAFQASDIQPGMVFYADTPAGQIPLTVSKVSDEEITVDMNHELAGKTLHFEIEVMQADPMTEEELKEFAENEEYHCCGKHKHGDGECCGKHKHEDGECCHGEGDCDCDCEGDDDCDCGGECDCKREN